MPHHITDAIIGVVVQPGSTCADINAKNGDADVTVYLSRLPLNYAANALAAIATGRSDVEENVHDVDWNTHRDGGMTIVSDQGGGRVTIRDTDGVEVTTRLDRDDCGELALHLTSAAYGL